MIYFTSMTKNIGVYLMALFYLLAGINHFLSPEGYYQIIPEYLGDPSLINIASGIAEIVFALLLLVPETRKAACYGIILMLIAFIPAHIQMIRTGFCIQHTLCLSTWVLWARLLIFQPLLIWWAWRVGKYRK